MITNVKVALPNWALDTTSGKVRRYVICFRLLVGCGRLGQEVSNQNILRRTLDN